MSGLSNSFRFIAFLLLLAATLSAQNPLCATITPQSFPGYLTTGAAQNVTWVVNIAPFDCAYTMDTSATPTWLTINNFSSVGNTGTINYSIAQNSTPAKRVGTFTLRGASGVSLQHFNNQNTTACVFQMTPATQNFSTVGGPGSINVTANPTSCEWIPDTTASWLTGYPNTSLVGNGSFNFTVASNGGASGRTGTFTLYGGTVPSPNANVQQAGTSTANLTVNPATLTFNYQQGGSAPAPQNVAVGSTGASLTFAASPSPAGQWLNVSPSSGSTPGQIAVSVATAGLNPGTYTGTIAVTSGTAGNSPQNIAVTLNVTAATPNLTLNPSSLTFNYQQGATNPLPQNVTVGSTGASLNFTATPSSVGNWLGVSPSSGSTSASLAVSVSPALLSPGIYTGTIAVTALAGNSPQSVAVTLNVAAAPANLTLSQTSLSFSYQQAGSTPPSQNVTVGSTGSALAFTASSNAPWLNVNPQSGATPGTLTVSVSPGSLGIGTSNGTITVTSAAAANSPRTIAVSITVTSTPSLTLSPGNLTFTYQQGGPPPGSQPVLVGSTGAVLNFTAGSNASWLDVAPQSGATPGNLDISVSAIGLGVGTYNSTITVASAGAGNSPQSIPVALTITAAPPISASPSTLTFTYSLGGAPPPPKTVSVTSGGVVATITTAASTTSGGNWLAVTPTSATTPASLEVSVTAGTLAAGTYQGRLTITSANSGSQTVDVTLIVSSQPILTVSPAGLQFSYRVGGPQPPPQSFSVFSAPVSTNFTVAVSTQNTGSWLTASPLTGQTSQAIVIGVNPANLQPGTYAGTATVSAPNAAPATRAVAVTLKVDPAPPNPILEVSPKDLSVSSVQGGSRLTYDLLITNPGSGTLRFNAQKSNGGAWLTVQNGAGTAPGGATISIDPLGLAPGVYGGQLQVTSPEVSQAQTVNVLLAVSRLPHSILLSQTGVEFIALAGSAAPPNQSVAVANSGQGRMDWTAETETLPTGLGWLRVTPGGGSHTAGSPPNTLQFGVDTAGLAPGRYYATARVLAPTAANNPQSISVALTVLRPEEIPGPLLSTSGVLQIAQAGGANPAAEAIDLYNLSNRAVGFTSTRGTLDGTQWFTTAPAGGTVPAGGSTRVSLTSQIAGLSPGIRQGTLRFGFDDGSVRNVNVLSSVAPPSTTDAPKSGLAAIPNCKPSKLLPQFLEPEDGFTTVAQSAKRIRVQVKDDCDNPTESGAVRAFVTGADFLLVHEGQGIWATTWTPPAALDPARVAAQAFQSQGAGRQIAGESPILAGRVVAAAATAQAAAAELRNNATNQATQQVALGSWVSIHGERLAEAVRIADTVPYPFVLESTEVRLGNLPLPLYYVSKDQVNALIPAGLIPNTMHQLLVRRGNTQSVPIALTVAEIQPGIYAMNSQGFGQGAVLLANTGTLAAPPGSVAGWACQAVKRGGFIQIYATGLGPVENPPPDGVPASGQRALEPPEALVGGQAAQVTFAGLLPGAIGLYQINVRIPDGAATGPAVSLQLRQREALSNIVTLAVE